MLVLKIVKNQLKLKTKNHRSRLPADIEHFNIGAFDTTELSIAGCDEPFVDPLCDTPACPTNSPKCGLQKRSAKLRPSNVLPLSWQGTEPVLRFALVKLNVQFRAAFF